VRGDDVASWKRLVITVRHVAVSNQLELSPHRLEGGDRRV
jgi:hypothetical protein